MQNGKSDDNQEKGKTYREESKHAAAGHERRRSGGEKDS
jgi:hypothetical protein